VTASLLIFSLPAASAYELPPSFWAEVLDRADVVVKGVRLTDNGDNDGFADPNETVSLYVTLRNSSGADRDGIVVTVGSPDATVDCIPSPVVAFGSLLAGEERESEVPAVFHVANVSRSDPAFPHGRRRSRQRWFRTSSPIPRSSSETRRLSAGGGVPAAGSRTVHGPWRVPADPSRDPARLT
jgi:hypothetical protein